MSTVERKDSERSRHYNRLADRVHLISTRYTNLSQKNYDFTSVEKVQCEKVSETLQELERKYRELQKEIIGQVPENSDQLKNQIAELILQVASEWAVAMKLMISAIEAKISRQ
jgi:hypothetical protein